MKLLLVHRYIKPDASGYAQMLYIIGQHLVSEGYDVTILSAQPRSSELLQGDSLPVRQRIDGMTVIRLPILDEAKRRPIARAANAGWFALALLAFGVTRRKKFDQIFVSTHPPLVMAAVARLIKSLRGSGYVYHCMDLYPEIAVDSGILRSERITLPLFKAIDKQNCKRADKVVVLSSDMKKTIAARDESVDNVLSLIHISEPTRPY